MAVSQAEKGEAFRRLHAGEPFVIPNPWDAGSAKALAKLGFQALASTSGGFAQTLGRSDGAGGDTGQSRTNAAGSAVVALAISGSED